MSNGNGDTIPNVDETVYSGFGEEMTGSGFDLIYPIEGEPEGE